MSSRDHLEAAGMIWEMMPNSLTMLNTPDTHIVDGFESGYSVNPVTQNITFSCSTTYSYNGINIEVEVGVRTKMPNNKSNPLKNNKVVVPDLIYAPQPTPQQSSQQSPSSTTTQPNSNINWGEVGKGFAITSAVALTVVAGVAIGETIATYGIGIWNDIPAVAAAVAAWMNVATAQAQ